MSVRLARLILGGCALAVAAPVLAQNLGTGQAPNVSIVRIVAVLIFCLLAAVALVFLLRNRAIGGRLRPGILGELGRRGRVRVIESRRISIHADLCLVEFEGEEILILCGSGGAEVLTRRMADVASSDPSSEAAN